MSAVTDTTQPVAESPRLRHLFKTEQIHQSRLAMHTADILKALRTIIIHKHEGTEENAWRAAAFTARSRHETIDEFVQSQAFESIHRHHQSGAGDQVWIAASCFAGLNRSLALYFFGFFIHRPLGDPEEFFNTLFVQGFNLYYHS